jgi:hypothetical protein
LVLFNFCIKYSTYSFDCYFFNYFFIFFFNFIP